MAHPERPRQARGLLSHTSAQLELQNKVVLWFDLSAHQENSQIDLVGEKMKNPKHSPPQSLPDLASSAAGSTVPAFI